MAGPLRAEALQARRSTLISTSRTPRLVIRKGFHRTINSYSAFRENDRKTPTGLAGYLRERGFERVTLCGLATDFCVFYSAIDAQRGRVQR